MTPKQINNFVKYEVVRTLGKYNMVTEMNDAAKEAQLSIDDYLEIIKNYNTYAYELNNIGFLLIKGIRMSSGKINYLSKYTFNNGNLEVHTIDEIVDIIISSNLSGDKGKFMVVQLPTLDDGYEIN